MTFIRLAGCNAPDLGLGCLVWCDTEGSWDPARGRPMAAAALQALVHYPRACVTGGEPLTQAGKVAELTALLQNTGVNVHLETNGTLDWPDAPGPSWITVSPKPPAYRISAGIAAMAKEIKIVYDVGMAAMDVVQASSAIRAIASKAPQATVCIQPEASGGQALAVAAARLVLANPDWRLSIQLHKVLGIP